MNEYIKLKQFSKHKFIKDFFKHQNLMIFYDVDWQIVQETDLSGNSKETAMCYELLYKDNKITYELHLQIVENSFLFHDNIMFIKNLNNLSFILYYKEYFDYCFDYRMFEDINKKRWFTHGICNNEKQIEYYWKDKHLK